MQTRFSVTTTKSKSYPIYLKLRTLETFIKCVEECKKLNSHTRFLSQNIKFELIGIIDTDKNIVLCPFEYKLCIRDKLLFLSNSHQVVDVFQNKGELNEMMKFVQEKSNTREFNIETNQQMLATNL